MAHRPPPRSAPPRSIASHETLVYDALTLGKGFVLSLNRYFITWSEQKTLPSHQVLFYLSSLGIRVDGHALCFDVQYSYFRGKVEYAGNFTKTWHEHRKEHC
jgi:hypothetical protein